MQGIKILHKRQKSYNIYNVSIYVYIKIKKKAKQNNICLGN